MAVEIRLLGTLEVITPTGRLTAADFPTRKAKQVLEVLALTLGRTVSKDALIDLLWRRRWPQNPTATVELAVSLLRSTLAKVTDERVVITEPGGYRLDSAVALIDLTMFDELVLRADRRAEAERLGVLREAVALVRGPLLEDEIGAEWLQPYRDRYRRRVEGAQLELARHALAHGDAALAHSVAEQAWSTSELVVEEAYAVGVAALVELGRRTEARALLSRVEERLDREEGRTTAVELLRLRALLQEPVASARPDVDVAVDPAFEGAPATPPFLGRVAELAAVETFIARALASDGTSGSLAVCGPAGIGRSRVLAEVVARAHGHWRVHELKCLATELDHPLLTVARLMRTIAKDARLRKQPVLDGSATAMFGRLAQMLDGLGPTLLVIDDLHLADPASAAVLRSLAGRGGAAHLCLVSSGAPARDGSRDSRKIVLGPLTSAEMEPLGIDSAWNETGGHPATLVACCAAGAAGGVLRGAALAGLRAQIEEAGPLAPAVLSAASRLPTTFAAAEVVVAVGLGPDLVSRALHAATEAGILRPSGGGRFEFSARVLRRVLAAETAATPGP